MLFRALRCRALPQVCTTGAKDCRADEGGGWECGAPGPGAPCRRQLEKQRRLGGRRTRPGIPAGDCAAAGMDGAAASSAGLSSERELTHLLSQRKIKGWPGRSKADQAHLQLEGFSSLRSCGMGRRSRSHASHASWRERTTELGCFPEMHPITSTWRGRYYFSQERRL